MSNFLKILEENYPIVIADLANNHSGDKTLAKSMIDELFELQGKKSIVIIPKFQYRDLDTYIHKKFKGNSNLKYVSRFESTRLEYEEFLELTTYAKSLGLYTAATPFDEYSAGKVSEHGHTFLKVASVSSNDWNLLETCVAQKMSMIVSTGGLSDFQIERLVTFLKHRSAEFVLMHCVALYPSSNDSLNLEKIRELREKFRVPVGFSTHENPNNFVAGGLALAAGAQILERHYAKSTEIINVNNYSSEQYIFEDWISSLKEALNQLRDTQVLTNLEKQRETLHQLQRGLYAARNILSGEKIDLGNTYSAIPVLENQFTTSELTIHSNLVAAANIQVNDPILKSEVHQTDNFTVKEKILSRTRELLSLAGLNLGPNIDVEISHHLGIENFGTVGAILVPILNREYAKKLVVMVSGQSHPEHYHKLKEETFLVLMGKLHVTLDREIKVLGVGEVLVITRNSKHSMLALEDTVFEEISSTNYSDDSYYSDSDSFVKNRKTPISLWF
jgi:sialic acid synthase SpsE/quercetin dioxygenase-like cupin family protein